MLRTKYVIYTAVLYIIKCISIPEPQCIGEYVIDLNPSQMNDNNDCKNAEIITATIDKVSICV